MKTSRYIGYFGIMFLILSCDNSTEPELESYDCNDYIDEICGSCSVNLWDDCYDIEETTELDLSLNDLTGEIPSELGNLTNLTYLHLGYNQLTGEIPSELGNLINLTELSLGGNQLTGEIPSELGNLTNLSVLRLFYNNLTGEIPSEIGNLYNLTFITLKYNQLSGEIPQQVCNLVENNNLYLPGITDGNSLTNTCED